LNVVLPGDPLAPRHHAFDPTFPDDVPPSQITANPPTIGLGSQMTAPLGIEPLAAQYDRYLVDPGVEEIVIDWSGVPQVDVLDVDAVVDVGGVWRRVQGSGGRLAFCRQRPAEAVDQLYLVLSNHDRTRGTHDGPGAFMTGSYTVTAGPCSSTTTTTTTTPEVTTTAAPLPPGCALYEDNHVYSRQDYDYGWFFEFDARFDHYEY